MKPSDELWCELREDLAERGERTRELSVARQRFLARSDRKPSHAWRWSLALIGAAAAVLLCWGVRGPRALSFQIGADEGVGQVGSWLAAPADSSLPLHFSDKSELDLQPKGRMRVLELGPQGAHVVLESGTTSASIAHRPDSHWVFDVGPFQIAVVGTRFQAMWEPREERFEVTLEEGSVQVTSRFLHEARTVSAGQTLRALCKEQSIETIENHTARRIRSEHAEALPGATDGSAATGATEDSVATGSRVTQRHDGATVDLPAIPALPLAHSPSVRAKIAEPPGLHPASPASLGWTELARANRFAEALAAAEREGFEAICRQSSGDALLLLGDTARLAGNRVRAAQAYRAARSKHPSQDRSAFGLGILAFDQERDYDGAAKWFATYLREQPDGALAGEALGREVEALHRLGDNAAARTAATSYLTRYPGGAHAPLARQLIAP